MVYAWVLLEKRKLRMINGMEAIENKKAGFDYVIIETLEAGIELRGFEVKSIKTGKAALTGSYAKLYGNELWLVSAHIPPYQEKNTPQDNDPNRARRLLVHKKELDYLAGKLKEQGLTLVPLKMYNKNGTIKVLLGLGKSKKKGDKRETIKKRDIERQEGRKFKGS